MPEEHHADPSNTVAWRNEISTRQLETEKIVSTQGNTLARIEQGMSDLANAVKSLAQDQRFDRKPFQWSVAISFATLVLGIAGAYTFLMMSPVRDQLLTNTARLVSLGEADLATARWQGLTEGQLVERNKRIAALEISSKENLAMHSVMEKNSSYTFGRMEAAEDRLDHLTTLVEKLAQRTYESKP